MGITALERVSFHGSQHILLEGRGYRPLGEVLEQKNRIFYSIPWDFLPFDTSDTQEMWTISANVNNFRGNISDPNGAFRGNEEITAHFWGIGYGGAHSNFVDFMRQKDAREGVDYFSRVHMILGDFSQEILSANMQRDPGIQAVRFDASQPLPFRDESADYIRFNELYDDLPGAEFIVRMGRSYYQLQGRLMLDLDRGIETRKRVPVSAEEFALEWWPGGIERLKSLNPNFLASVGYQVTPKSIRQPQHHPAYGFIEKYCGDFDEILVPLNWGAKRNLDECLRILKPGGGLEFFDYGFFDPQFLIDHRKDIVRTIMGQPTVVVNFPFLLADIDRDRFEVTEETQAQYLRSNFPFEFISSSWFLDNKDNFSAFLPTGADVKSGHFPELEASPSTILEMIKALAGKKMWMTSLDITAALRAFQFTEESIQRTIDAMLHTYNSAPDGGLYHVEIRKR